MTTDTEIPKTVSLAAPDMALFGSAQRAMQAALGTRITSELTYKAAAEDLVQIKGIAKKLEDQRVELKRPILEAGRGIDAFFSKPLKWCSDAEAYLKGVIGTHQQKLEAERREAQRKADEVAAATRKILEDKADKAKDPEKAESLREAAQMVMPATVAAPAIANGISTRKIWKTRIESFDLLLRYLVEHPEFHGWVEIQNSEMNQYVRATQGKVKIPGVQIYQDEVVAARGG